MTVQVGLCRTCSETTLLVFPRGGSYDNISGNRKYGTSIWNIEWATASSFDNLDYCDSYVHVSFGMRYPKGVKKMKRRVAATGGGA